MEINIQEERSALLYKSEFNFPKVILNFKNDETRVFIYLKHKYKCLQSHY